MGTVAAATCSVKDLKVALEKGEPCQVIDVRESAEYSAEHMEPSNPIPLSSLKSQLEKISRSAKTYILCRSGKRAGMAAELLAKEGFQKLTVVSGGILAWKAAGYPVKEAKCSVWPIERQVKLTAGILVTLGSILAFFSSPLWAILPAVMGFGLTFVAITDNCMMGLLLMRMPWNKPKQ